MGTPGIWLSEDELATSRRFTRIFPTNQSFKYFKFLEKPRYYNLLLSAWEQRYSGINKEAGRSLLEKLCLSKHHLKVPANVYVKKTALGTQETIDISGLAAPDGANAPLLATEGGDAEKADQMGQGSGVDSQQDTEVNPIQPSASLDVAEKGNFEALSSASDLGTNEEEEEEPDKTPRKVKASSVRVVAKPHNVRVVSPGANWGAAKTERSCIVPATVDMECGSDTPSPKNSPVHPGFDSIESSETGTTPPVVDNRKSRNQELSSASLKVDNHDLLVREPVVDNRPDLLLKE